jgi:uncharacterized UPF0160 family protein
MRVATHNGSFHADEVFAVAALGRLGESLDIIRSRDPAELAAADLRIDVGFRDDPGTGDFDHHQREFDRARENGIRYASFGLVWRHFGERICDGDAELAAAVDATLVQGIDANDTGQPLTRTLIDGVRPITVNGIIGGFNPTWEEESTAETDRQRFDAAVELAEGILVREIASAAAGLRAVRIVRQAITAAEDPRLVELPLNLPWKSVLVPEAPQALYVIYPKRQGFGLEAVPSELGSFDTRRPLPADWAGLEGEALAAVTGVEDVLFCHAKRFLAVAGTREAIGRLAAQALPPGHP